MRIEYARTTMNLGVKDYSFETNFHRTTQKNHRLQPETDQQNYQDSSGRLSEKDNIF